MIKKSKFLKVSKMQGHAGPRLNLCRRHHPRLPPGSRALVRAPPGRVRQHLVSLLDRLAAGCVAPFVGVLGQSPPLVGLPDFGRCNPPGYLEGGEVVGGGGV